MAFKLALDASKVGMMTTANDGERRRMGWGGGHVRPLWEEGEKKKGDGTWNALVGLQSSSSPGCSR